jgi:hypothetical protein
MFKTALHNIFRSVGYDIVKTSRGDVYYRDGMRTEHNHEFSKTSGFVKAYNRGIEGTKGQAKIPGPWRVHIAIWAAQNALRHEGDFVECGVYLGFVSSVVMTYVEWNKVANDRRFLLVDNFEGIVPELLTDEERRLGRSGQFGSNYRDTYHRAATNVSEFKNVELIKGSVPDVLSSVKTDRVSYLHLDMNSAAPEIAALRFFWGKLVPGAVILLDDYAFAGYEPQQHAVDELASVLGFSVASLPTGQGLIIK